MQQTFRTPAAYGNQFIKKYVMPKYDVLDYMYNHREKTYHILEGPVRSGKTTDNITMFCQEIEKSKDILFLTIGITQGAAKTILWEGDGLGIAHYPDWQARTFIKDGKRYKVRQRIFATKYKGMDALALLPKHNSDHPVKYILAFGSDKANSQDGYKGMSIGMVIATQWELFHPNTRVELLKRTIASSRRKYFIDLNPISPNADIYKEFDRWIKQGNVNYKLKLMKDNPILTDELIEEIKADYDPNSIDYQRDILGKRVAPQGTIYTVRDYNIIKDFDVNDYRTFVIVADIGQTNSATVFTLTGLTTDFKYVDVLKEYYHKNADEKDLGIKMPIDYAIDYQDFINECANMIGFVPREILADNDITFVREFERTKHNARLGSVYLNHTFKKDEIHDRIKTGINDLYTGRMRFYEKCTHTITAFKTATYDVKAKDKGKYVRYDNPADGTMIDPIDSVEYARSRMKLEIDRYKGGGVIGR